MLPPHVALGHVALMPAKCSLLQRGTSLQAADVSAPCAAARRGGSKHMRLLAQHSVGENPYSRAPLHAAMAGLAQRPDAGGALLLDQPLAKLHPASWCDPVSAALSGLGSATRLRVPNHSKWAT